VALVHKEDTYAQCIYGSPEMHCNRCKEKRLLCGEKILAKKGQDKASSIAERRRVTTEQSPRLIDGQKLSMEYIPESSQPLDDIRLSQNDMQYMQYLFCMPGCGLWKSNVFGIHYLFRDMEVAARHLIPLPIHSKPLRYAMLALASSRKDGPSSIQSLEHMKKFYHSIYQASVNSSIDMIYGNYVIYRRGLRSCGFFASICWV